MDRLVSVELGSVVDAVWADEQDWRKDGLCAQTDPELFFPLPRDGENTRAAKRICAACPVRAICAEWAIERGEREGVWGGLTPQQRRAERRRRRLGLAVVAGGTEEKEQQQWGKSSGGYSPSSWAPSTWRVSSS